MDSLVGNMDTLILLGNKCILTNMERERRLRRGSRMGSQQDENWLSKVQRLGFNAC